MSRRRDGSWVKAQRLKQIARMIATTFPAGCDYNKMVLLIKVEIGLTEKRAREYLEDVIEARGWRVVDGVIKPEVTAVPLTEEEATED